MASSSFRDSINSLGWARRDADLPVNTSQQSGLLSSLKSLNPFGDRGYVQLPTTEGAGAPLPAPSRREEEEGWFACESTPRFPAASPTPHFLVYFPYSQIFQPRQDMCRLYLPMSQAAPHSWALLSVSYCKCLLSLPSHCHFLGFPAGLGCCRNKD
jgi:hypothetical protein